MNPALIIGLGVGIGGFFLLRKNQQQGTQMSGAEKVAREAAKAGVPITPTAPGDEPGVSFQVGDKIVTGTLGGTSIVETDESQIELFPDETVQPDNKPSGSVSVLGGQGFAPGTDPSASSTKSSGSGGTDFGSALGSGLSSTKSSGSGGTDFGSALGSGLSSTKSGQSEIDPRMFPVQQFQQVLSPPTTNVENDRILQFVAGGGGLMF